MSIILRHVLIGTCLSLLVFIFVAGETFTVFPLLNLSDLWEKEVLDIHYILFVPSVSMVIGIVFGTFSGLFWKKQLQSIDEKLHLIEEGRPLEKERSTSSAELASIIKRMSKIQKQMAEQAKVSQRLATEAAEEQESRIQEIISQERNRLARELHDSVSQQLFGASMLMSAINEGKTNGNDRETKQLKLVEEMIHQSQLEMRALLLHLRPVALKGKSLQEGIEELLIELTQKVSMNIKWKIEDFTVEKGVEDHLFRILQESVSNTLRHAKASSLEVLLIRRDGFIILRVSDDGIGFDIDEGKAGSYGLQNMHDRAVEIGGNLKIVSLKQKGTRLEVKIPVIEGEDND